MPFVLIERSARLVMALIHSVCVCVRACVCACVRVCLRALGCMRVLNVKYVCAGVCLWKNGGRREGERM